MPQFIKQNSVNRNSLAGREYHISPLQVFRIRIFDNDAGHSEIPNDKIEATANGERQKGTEP